MSNGNRKIRRGSQNSGSMMQSPCSISEAVQIARGVAEDTIADYHRNQGNIQLSMSLQIEIMKEVLFSAGIISEEDFRNKYMEKAQELQKMQSQMVAEAMDDNGITSMTGEVGDIEVKTE